MLTPQQCKTLKCMFVTVPWSGPTYYDHPRTGYGLEVMFPRFYSAHECDKHTGCKTVEAPRPFTQTQFLGEYGHYFETING